MSGLLSRKIRVTLIDDRTGETLRVSKMTSSELEGILEPDVAIEHGDDGEEWFVADADATSSAEYEARGQLTLRLRPVELVDPKQLWMSLPTVSGEMPELGSDGVQESDCVLFEDDWRQFEFVANDLAHVVETQCEEIERVFEGCDGACGFRESHPRNEPMQPLRGEFSLEEIIGYLGVPATVHGLSFHGCDRRVRDGFAISLDGEPLLYGLAPNGGVTVLAIVQLPRKTLPDVVIEGLLKMANRWDLMLVHWCSFAPIETTLEAYRDLLLVMVNAAEDSEDA